MAADEILFDVVLEPNPPLHSRHVLLVLGAVAVLSFVTGVLFVLQGAWPVTPFFGADVALLAWAFMAVRRASRRRERLLLTRDALIIERVGANGACVQETVNPYWLRVDHNDPERIGTDLALVWKGKRYVVGSFMGADDRASLAEALRHALRRAREPAAVSSQS
jgi:uncharacterized membrane protein